MLWFPPNVWLHGSQSTSTGGSSARNGQMSSSAAWFEHIIRCVLMTPLGTPVDPDVNRSLPTVSGPTLAKASSTAGPGEVFTSSSSRSASERFPCATSVAMSPATTASSAVAKASASAANTSPGFVSSAICLIRRWSALISEYATLIGITGTPAVYAPSVTSMCSSELADRIISGRSGPSPRSRNACASAPALAFASP